MHRYFWILALFPLMASCGSGEKLHPGGLIQTDPTGSSSIARRFEFGIDETYRLGDGEASLSSCLGSFSGREVSGAEVKFKVEILEENTEIQFSVDGICGVDMLKNVVSITDSSGLVLASRLLRINQSREDLPRLVLNPGIYELRIEAGGEIEPVRGYDLDDFVFDRILVEANRGVRKLSVETPSSLARSHEVDLGADTDFRLGDGATDILNCIFAADSGQTLSQGQGVQVSFSVAIETRFQMFLHNICGIDYPLNSIFLQNSQSVLMEYSLEQRSTQLGLPSLVLPPGEYAVLIRSLPDVGGQDLDDWIFRNLIFASSSPLVGISTQMLSNP